MCVQKINTDIYKDEKIYKHYLPKNICFDEFQFKTRIMSFNICNADTGKTIDIVYDRQQDKLNKYFSYYSKETRSKVENVVIDMYKPYIGLIVNNFPDAKIIIDRFHLIQLISKAMNKTRIKAMKLDKTKYRKMKRYWKLILKSRFELDGYNFKRYMCFPKYMTEVDVLNFILEDNLELKSSYELYQSVLYAIQNNNYDLLITILNQEHLNISDYLTTTLKTLREFLPYIKNTLSSSLSNGVIERNNNTIKLIKRICFGFRNFINFRARILIITSLFRLKKRTNVFSSISP